VSGSGEAATVNDRRAAERGPALREAVQAWRVARISALYETLQPGRLAGVLAQLALQIFLTWCLWMALYQSVPSSGGLDRTQAVTYAVLATLYGRLRGPDRYLAQDTVAQHVREGSILYWYLRPVTPRRYHWLRAVGDHAYGLAWAVFAYLACRVFGLVEPPASAAAAGLFLLTLALGQAVLYYLLALVDVACFWTLNNFGVLAIIRLAQNLFAGAIVPLWFFPGWFQTVSSWLPFESSLHVPLSLYIGRIAPADAGRYVLLQLVWIVLLALVLRRFWRRADAQVVVQGG
jgi:ABC-2 type transport system permease protein